MTDEQKTQKLAVLISELQKMASKKHCYDKFGDDYSPSENGNYDDAFDEGLEYGEICYARCLIEKLNKIEPEK